MCNTVETGGAALLRSLALLPSGVHVVGDLLLGKDVRMPSHQFRDDSADHLGDVETALLGTDLAVKDHLQQQVTQFLDDVVVAAGFQGINEVEDTTTLGRGGSDTTAVAVAAALDADVCEIYTDVDGIFTADPRIVPGARGIPSISYEEMLETAASGAKVLHLRCVEYARREDVRVHVRSSFSDKPDTWVMDVSDSEEEREASMPDMEEAIISGVCHDRSEAKITIAGIPDSIGRAAKIFEIVARADINIDMIVQNVSQVMNGRTDITFTLPMSDSRKAIEALRRLQGELGFEDLLYDDQIGKLSLVGAGMRTNTGVSATFFKALADAGVNIEMISTSEIRISVVTRADQLDDALRALHTAFELDSDEGEAVVYAGTGR